MSEHACGPSYAKPFFDAVKQAALESGALSNYYIVCVDHETDILGIDFEKQVGVTKLSNNELITEFVPRKSIVASDELIPYKWLGSTPISFISKSDASGVNLRGPAVDTDFFERLDRISSEHPADSRTYSVMSKRMYSDVIKLSDDEDVVEGTIRDGKVYRKVQPGNALPASCVCCTWDDETGDCNGTWCDQ